ncbi:hypothetical protein [Microbacterium sp. TWP3-1-2b2]|uniref:hypothetical protein n=1 Tax=Microbacterium sp. TWP3-1-2b2 TaxID=2804651 RepID=UPI003CF30255
MPRTAKLAATVAALVLAAALAGCTATAPQQSAEQTSTPTATATPTPAYLTELPAWALGTGMPWFIYPDGFECFGTEGCPNDYVAFFGEPGPFLPEGVVYYDPAIHGDMVTPVDQ